jgi:hypothetical protein
MPEVKYNQSHHAGATPEARIAARLKPSGVGRGTQPDHMVTHGTGPTRTVTAIHNSAGHVPVGRDSEEGK